MAKRSHHWSLIAGRHPVLEAMAAGRRMREIIVAEGVTGANVTGILEAAAARGIPVKREPRAVVDRLARTPVHQGVVAYVRAISYASLDEVLKKAPPGEGLLVVAAGIEDPHNLGALIRSADAAGAHGVIVGKHRAVGLNESAIKASAGAALHLPVVQVINIVDALDRLKEAGYWVYGAVGGGDRTLWEADLRGNVVIVIGSEGRGISRLILERCDFKISIPMLGSVSSLNASVAGALILYEAQRQRVRN